jgi:hypothetical protein
VRWFRDIAVLLALGWLLLVALTTARAQEPTPTASACVGIETEGGQTTVHGPIQVTLPEGDFTRTIAPPNMPPYGWRFCHVETGATILISDTCEEVSREASGEEAQAILNAIIESCVVVPPNVPPPGVDDCPAGGVPFEGSQTVILLDAIEITLPEGDFIVAPYPENVVQICMVGGSPTFTLSLIDCHRVDITPPNDPDAELVQAIVGSCVPLNPPPEPTTGPFTPSSNIQPPNTGDAGLLIR